MRVWAVCVVTFFGAAELYQWAQGLALPLPIYGVAGLLLAIASNADRLGWLQSGQSSLTTQQPTPLESLRSQQVAEQPVETSFASSPAGPQLPNFFQPSSSPSISFTIRAASKSKTQN